MSLAYRESLRHNRMDDMQRQQKPPKQSKIWLWIIALAIVATAAATWYLYR